MVRFMELSVNKDYEYVCNECHGRGFFSSEVEMIDINVRGTIMKVPGVGKHDFCRKCMGTGKLDWIENVLGTR